MAGEAASAPDVSLLPSGLGGVVALLLDRALGTESHRSLPVRRHARGPEVSAEDDALNAVVLILEAELGESESGDGGLALAHVGEDLALDLPRLWHASIVLLTGRWRTPRRGRGR